MDRHVKWLRRRIIASIATQSVETFVVVAIAAFAVMQWRTDEGPLASLFGAVVIAQLLAVARVGFAMRNNPLNYVFMRKYVERPFNYRVARFQGEDEANPVAAQLPGFAPVATIRDADADPEPVFDIYHDSSRLVAASISRASGALALVSSLSDGRILVTDARVVPAHERLVLSLATDDSIEAVIATHQQAIAARTDVVELASSAHQVVLDSLTIEYDSFLALGPALSPFLDLEPQARKPLRLTARIKKEELVMLPVRLGPDKPLPDVRVTAPLPALIEAPAGAVAPVRAAIVAAEVVTPDVPSATIAPAQVPTAAVDMPVVVAVAEVAAVEVAAVEVEAVVVPPIAPPAYVTVEPEAADFVDYHDPTFSEPITAEVAPITFTEASIPEPIQVDSLVAQHLGVYHHEQAADAVPADAAAPDAPHFVVPAVPATAPTFAPLPQFSARPPGPPATLAEAVVAAPDTAAALVDGVATEQPVPQFSGALEFGDVTTPSRPRLSSVLRAQPAPASAAPTTKRSRRKSR